MTAPANSAVFLSYASQDAEAARRICEALRAGGIEVWFDQSELRGGDAWDQNIRQQIRDCALFVPIISTNTRSRREGYFRVEWDLADQRTHRLARNRAFIVPVCTDDTPDSAADVPESFERVQWTRLPGGETPTAFVERMNRLLSPEHSEVPVSRAQGAPPLASKSKLVPMLLVVFALIGLGYVAWRALTQSMRTPTSTAPASTPSAIPELSVAVLPFVNMSPDRDQEYFSDGLTEEMIDLLGRLPDLRVPARTSSFYFKGRNEAISSIAQQLKVAHVLEGSVRKSGKRLRITAQLIRADSGYHLWSQTYDRDDKDIFAVQDDIAQAVVKALQVKLTAGKPVSVSRGNANTEAYNQYLLAQQSYRHGNLEGYRHAVAAFERAISLDPMYAAAYSGLALARAWAGDQTGDWAMIEQASRDAEKSVALDPNEATGYAVRGFIRTNWFWDWSGAQADIAKALALDPRSSEAQSHNANVLDSVGRVADAVAAQKQATELDPLSSAAWVHLGNYSTELRDYRVADAAYARALELEPTSAIAFVNLGILRLLQGNTHQSLEVFEKMENGGFRLAGIAMAEYTLGNATRSDQAMRELEAKWSREGAFQIAEAHAWRGEIDAAFQWLERAYQQKDGGLASVRGDPLLNSLHGDPRFNALLRKLKLPELTAR